MPEPDIDTAAVETANADFYGAFEAGDIELMGDLWADGAEADAVTCVHPGWPMLRGREEVLRSWALIMANTAYIQFVLTEVYTEVRGDQAVVTCEENILTSDNSDGDVLAGGSVVSTNMFVRDAGRWKLWLHHASPVLNQNR